MQTEMSSSPTGGLCLPSGKHTGILTYFQTMSTKKRPKKNFFLVISAKASSRGFVPDVLPILTPETTDTRLRGHKLIPVIYPKRVTSFQVDSQMTTGIWVF